MDASWLSFLAHEQTQKQKNSNKKKRAPRVETAGVCVCVWREKGSSLTTQVWWMFPPLSLSRSLRITDGKQLEREGERKK